MAIEREQVNFQLNDDEVRCVLDQQRLVGFYSADLTFCISFIITQIVQ
jgi:hypothetical protein